MNDEQFDFKIHRIQKGHSTCFQKGNWAYLDSNGGLHKIRNEGYYGPWKSNMWVHSYWSKSINGEWVWVAGEIASTKGGIISLIENSLDQYRPWTHGFGKHEGIEIGV
jgi:hypothetical protein